MGDLIGEALFHATCLERPANKGEAHWRPDSFLLSARQWTATWLRCRQFNYVQLEP